MPSSTGGMIGNMITNPFNEREYVTITGHDAVKNRVTFKDKTGKTGTISSDVVDLGEPITKASLANNSESVPVNYYGTKAGPVNPEAGMKAQNSFEPTMSGIDAHDNFGTKAEGVEGLRQDLKTENDSYKAGKLGLAAASFMADVMNANSAYNTVVESAALNIAQAKNNAADALYRGRQAQLDRQSEGYAAGQDATLAMAAQGQDVNGPGVSKIRGSYEAMGIENGMREEANSIREALGYQLEEVNYNYQVDNASIQRKYAIIGSALNFGANVYAYGR